MINFINNHLFLFKIITFISLIFISILYPIGDGLKIRWKQSNDDNATKRLSKLWHGVGLMIKFFIFLAFLSFLPFISYYIPLTILLMFIMILLSIGYNVIIQAVLGEPLFKVGTTATTDIFLRKIWMFLKKILLKIKNKILR